MKRHGLPFREDYVLHSSLQVENGSELLDYFWGLAEPPTAIFAVYDPLALTVITALKDRGMKVPDVLLSGDHQRVAKWRRAQSLIRTLLRRPHMARARPQLIKELEDLLEDPKIRADLDRNEISKALRSLKDDAAEVDHGPQQTD